MLSKSRLLAAALALTLSQAAPAALNIVFDYTYDTHNFFADADRRAVLEAAGNYFESVIADDLLAINSGGPNNYKALFTAPGTGAAIEIDNFSVAADTIVIFAGARNLGGSLGVGGPGGYSISGLGGFFDDVISRGEGDGTASAVNGPGATDFASWGGQVTFDLNNNWYVDDDVSTLEGFGVMDDLYSVALHEIAHVLGYGTTDSWNNLISGGNFIGAASMAAHGGPVPLGGGGGHWAAGTISTIDGLFQEAALDPNLTVGTRKLMTDLDLAGLADIGWEVVVVPLPLSAWFMLSGLVSISLARRRQS